MEVHMIGKRAITVAAGSVLMLAATSGLVLAHGFGGRGRGGHEMFMLARAAGVSHDQIRTAFENSNLRTDRTNLKTAHEAVMTCLVTGKDCTSQIASFSNAVQTMTHDRLTMWQTVFKNAPNPSGAANVYAQLQQLKSQQKQIFQGLRGSEGGGGGPQE
jgi:hypothetical protein